MDSQSRPAAAAAHEPYVPPQGVPSLERKLTENARGDRLEPEWGEVRIVMRERDDYREALQRIARIREFNQPDKTFAARLSRCFELVQKIAREALNG